MGIKIRLYVTAVDGTDAEIICSSRVVADAIIAALKTAGAVWAHEADCWDFGFYSNRKPTVGTGGALT